jgi:hypothetical protein
MEAEEYTKRLRIKSEQKTQQEFNRQRFESEKAIAKQHSDTINAGLYATEQFLRRNFN